MYTNQRIAKQEKQMFLPSRTLNNLSQKSSGALLTIHRSFSLRIARTPKHHSAGRINACTTLCIRRYASRLRPRNS